MNDIPSQIDEILKDRKKFDDYVYTDIHTALKTIKERSTNQRIEMYLNSAGVYQPKLLSGNNLVLFRNIATLNYEILRFMILTEPLEDFKQTILEYHDDYFTNRNEVKFNLLKLALYRGDDSNGQFMYTKKVIADVNKSNMVKFKEIATYDNQNLIAYHHKRFLDRFPHMSTHIIDFSLWLQNHGPRAKDYYKKFLMLFLRDNILFENFIPIDTEGSFVRSVVLPALLEIENEIGCRPIIVALEPTTIEGSSFWLSYPPHFNV